MSLWHRVDVERVYESTSFSSMTSERADNNFSHISECFCCSDNFFSYRTALLKYIFCRIEEVWNKLVFAGG